MNKQSPKLLLDEHPLLVFPKLAMLLGLNEAILLQQLHYWLLESTHQYEGRWWWYNTYEHWQENFPFWSPKTIFRTIRSLEAREIILSEKLARFKSDHTKWYSINYEKLDELMRKKHGKKPVDNSPSGRYPGKNINTIRARTSDQIDLVKMTRSKDTKTTKDYTKTTFPLRSGHYRKISPLWITPPRTKGKGKRNLNLNLEKKSEKKLSDEQTLSEGKGKGKREKGKNDKGKIDRKLFDEISKKLRSGIFRDDLFSIYDNLSDKKTIEELVEDAAYSAAKSAVRNNEEFLREKFNLSYTKFPFDKIAQVVRKNFPYKKMPAAKMRVKSRNFFTAGIANVVVDAVLGLIYQKTHAKKRSP